MSIYVERSVGDGSARELEQGDVLEGVMLPVIPQELSFGFQRTGGGGKHTWVWKKDFSAAELLAEENKSLRVMSKLKREPHVLVLGNSCDIFSGQHSIWVAPIVPFTHYDTPAIALRRSLADIVGALAKKCGAPDCARVATVTRASDALDVCDECAHTTGGGTDVPHATILREAVTFTPDRREQLRQQEQWMSISRVATGANPKTFYMPASPKHAFVRSEADMTLAQPIDPNFLTKCLRELGATRVFGVNAEGVAHLQYTIASFFGRNPRDDRAWPSNDDLVLKRVWLQEQLTRYNLDPSEREGYEAELTWIRERVGE